MLFFSAYALWPEKKSNSNVSPLKFAAIRKRLQAL